MYHIGQWSHVTDNSIFRFFSDLFFFFMAYFFYKGGVYAKNKSFKETIHAGVKRLLVPFAVFSVIGSIFEWIDLLLCGEYDWSVYFIRPIKVLLTEGSFPGNLPLWFLLSLFVVRALFCGLIKFRYSDYLIILIILGLWLIKDVNFFCIGHEECLPLYFYNIPAGLACFWAGYRCKDLQYNKGIFYACLGLLVFITWSAPSHFDFREMKNINSEQGNLLLFILSSIAACIVINYALKKISKHVHFNFLTRIGRESMIFYCIHWIVLTIIHFSMIIPFQIENGLSQFIVYTFSSLTIIPLSYFGIQKLRPLTGQNT